MNKLIKVTFHQKKVGTYDGYVVIKIGIIYQDNKEVIANLIEIAKKEHFILSFLVIKWR